MSSTVTHAHAVGGASAVAKAALFACAVVHTTLLGAHVSWYLNHSPELAVGTSVFGVELGVFFMIQMGSIAVAGVAFLYYISKLDLTARSNFPDARLHRRGWPVLSFLVPVIQLGEPLECIKRIWIASNPAISPSLTEKEKHRAIPVFFDVWWICLVSAFVFTIAQLWIRLSMERLVLGAAAALLWITASLLAIAVVRSFSKLQAG